MKVAIPDDVVDSGDEAIDLYVRAFRAGYLAMRGTRPPDKRDLWPWAWDAGWRTATADLKLQRRGGRA